MSVHWLTFDTKRRVTGCHCGYVAKDEDGGLGDSVVEHLLLSGAAEGIAQENARLREENAVLRQVLIGEVKWARTGVEG